MPLIEGHYTVDGFYEAIDDAIEEAWEDFLNQASCHFRPELMDCGAVEIEDFEEYENNYPQPDEDDDLPF